MVTCFAGSALPRDEHTLVTPFILHRTVGIVRYRKTVGVRGGVCERCGGRGVECVSGVGVRGGVCEGCRERGGVCECEGWSV